MLNKINSYFYLILFSLSIILYNYDVFLIEYIFFIPLFIFLYKTPQLNYKKISGTILFVSLAVIISTYWIYSTKQANFLTIYLANAVFYFTFIFSIYILKKLKIKYYLLYSPLIYFTLMGFLNLFPYGNFWINISQTATYLTPISYYIGTIGLSGVLIFLQASLTHIIFDKKKYTHITVFIVSLIIVIIPIISSIFLEDNNNEDKKSLKIAGIQGNLNLTYHEKLSKKKYVFNYYLNQSKKAMKKDQNIDLIVWPEYTLPKNITSFQLKVLRDFIDNTSLHFAIGSERINKKANENYNTFYIINKSSTQYYDAFHPINLQTDIKSIAKTNKQIIINNISVGFLLCYDEMYPDSFVKQIKNNNAELFVLGGNLGFLDNIRGLELISLNGKTRTAETKREFLRIGTNGFTSHFNVNGEMTNSLEPFKSGILIEEVSSNSDTTTYVEYFYIIHFILYIMSFLTITLIIIVKIILIRINKE